MVEASALPARVPLLLPRLIVVALVVASAGPVAVAGARAERQELQVLGAGFGRTGTSSTLLALERLGLRSTHMFEVWRQPRAFLPALAASSDGDASQLVDLLAREGYNATLDFPFCVHLPQLAARYPRARVLLTVRADAAAWVRSVKSTIWQLHVHFRERPFSFLLPLLAGPQFERFNVDFWENITGLPFESIKDEHLAAAYDRHVADVKRAFPVDRLLVFDVREGWAPLCAFLRVPAARCPSEPFPRVNDADEMGRLVAVVRLTTRVWPLLCAAPFALLWLAWRCCCGARRAAKGKRE